MLDTTTYAEFAKGALETLGVAREGEDVSEDVFRLMVNLLHLLQKEVGTKETSKLYTGVWLRYQWEQDTLS